MILDKYSDFKSHGTKSQLAWDDERIVNALEYAFSIEKGRNKISQLEFTPQGIIATFK